MQNAEVKSYNVTIWISGDADQARQACREFCYRNSLCVTVTPTTFIYVGGEEVGVAIRLLNYPRFPETKRALWVKAQELAEFLRERLYQHSYLLEAPDNTEWVTRRDDNPAARG